MTDMKDYKKAITELQNSDYYMAVPVIFGLMSYLFVFLMIHFAYDMDDNYTPFIPYYFMTLTMTVTYLLVRFPLTGTSPSVKRELRVDAQTRDQFGGTTSMYDSLCVMPTTRRKIAQIYMKTFRIFEIPLLLIWLAGTVSFALNEPKNSTLCFDCTLIMNALVIISVFLTSSRKTTANTISGAVLFILSMLVFIFAFVVEFIDKAADIPLPEIMSFQLPTVLRLILVAAPLLFTEICMAKTALSPNRYYARNGESTE